jgi:adenine-specific DNA-methyltransferase
LARRPKATAGSRPVEALTHANKRLNIPTAELQSLAQQQAETAPLSPVRYPRETPLRPGETRPRNPDLDPQLIWNGARIKITEAQEQQLLERGEIELGDAQLVWRGKDAQDWSDLVVNPPPIYIQEKVHPKAIIDGLRKEAKARADAKADAPDLFADFNGLPDPEARVEFYQHGMHWSNRMILGDSLQVMASLAEREGLRGKVQCIYFDPPYGIKFNSNWQVSTLSRDVKDGKREDISREPEQVKAFRDTWKNGINSYLSYLRDRITVARELLTGTGSIFVQIGDENVHLVKSLVAEVFGVTNSVATIGFAKTSGSTDRFLGQTTDYIIWFAKELEAVKFRPLMKRKVAGDTGGTNYTRLMSPDRTKNCGLTQDTRNKIEDGWLIYALDNLTSQSAGREKGEGAASWFPVSVEGNIFRPSITVRWKTNELGMGRLRRAGRLGTTENRVGYIRFLEDFPAVKLSNRWDDAAASFMADKTYVVQTSPTVIQRCVLMASDPGDLVLDPTCGSGTTATIAEEWGRRWITIDTSRVALALAGARLMSANIHIIFLRIV